MFSLCTIQDHSLVSVCCSVFFVDDALPEKKGSGTICFVFKSYEGFEGMSYSIRPFGNDNDFYRGVRTDRAAYGGTPQDLPKHGPRRPGSPAVGPRLQESTRQIQAIRSI